MTQQSLPMRQEWTREVDARTSVGNTTNAINHARGECTHSYIQRFGEAPTETIVTYEAVREVYVVTCSNGQDE